MSDATSSTGTATIVVHVIASGFVADELDDVVAAYAGFTPLARLGDGWQAVLLERVR